jgi:hypothetical protein
MNRRPPALRTYLMVARIRRGNPLLFIYLAAYSALLGNWSITHRVRIKSSLGRLIGTIMEAAEWDSVFAGIGTTDSYATIPNDGQRQGSDVPLGQEHLASI